MAERPAHIVAAYWLFDRGSHHAFPWLARTIVGGCSFSETRRLLLHEKKQGLTNKFRWLLALSRWVKKKREAQRAADGTQ